MGARVLLALGGDACVHGTVCDIGRDDRGGYIDVAIVGTSCWVHRVRTLPDQPAAQPATQNDVIATVCGACADCRALNQHPACAVYGSGRV
jgi:hypothetical protein